MTRKKEAGQALVFAALGLAVLAGFAGLGVDMGMLRYQKRLQQTAADAAALAGANNLGYGSAGVTAGAKNASAQDGFTDGANNVTVTINNPPTSGPHSADANYVEALVTAVQPTYFMRVIGINSETITARAVATNTSGGVAGGGGCIYTLGTPQKKLAGVGVGGSVILNAPTCGIVDNGNFDANGGAQLSVTAASIGVGGAIDIKGSGQISPTPTPGMPYSGDPFANKYPAPCSGSGCTGGKNVKITAGKCNGAGCGNVNCNAGTCAFAPGNYGAISIDNNQSVNFAAGTYVVDGNFTVNAGSTVCNSTNPNCSGMVASANAGVTFYITGNGAVTINGTAQVQLAAPNSGTYEGLLFYQDPGDTQAASLSGNSSSLYQGAIYMPTAQLTFGGNTNFNNGAAYTVIVVDELQVQGNPDVNLQSNYSGLANGGGPLVAAITSATLVE